LIENLEEFFSEIKSSSSLKNFCHRERRDGISQICSTSTRLHKGNQRNLIAFFTPGQAIGADRSGNWRRQSEACRGGLSRRSITKPEELRSNPKPGNAAQLYGKLIQQLFSP
jgi:hypothetical protein